MLKGLNSSPRSCTLTCPTRLLLNSENAVLVIDGSRTSLMRNGVVRKSFGGVTEKHDVSNHLSRDCCPDGNRGSQLALSCPLGIAVGVPDSYSCRRLNCQPPMSAAASPVVLRPIVLPGPSGSSYSAVIVT